LGVFFYGKISMFSLSRLVNNFIFCPDIQKAYEEIDGRQQGRFAKQVSLYVKMLQNNKDIL